MKMCEISSYNFEIRKIQRIKFDQNFEFSLFYYLWMVSAITGMAMGSIQTPPNKKFLLIESIRVGQANIAELKFLTSSKKFQFTPGATQTQF